MTVRIFNLDLGLIIVFNGEASGRHDEHFVPGIIGQAAVAVGSQQLFLTIDRVVPLLEGGFSFSILLICAFLKLPF